MFILMDIISDSAFLRKILLFFVLFFAVHVLCSPPEKPLCSIHCISSKFLFCLLLENKGPATLEKK